MSQIDKIYVPLGFLCPLSFFVKVLIQRLRMAGFAWDDVALPDICAKWQQFVLEMPNLSTFDIPRMLLTPNVETCELHAFCDASELGYATVIYIRFTEK